MSEDPQVSIVITVMNEEENIRPLLDQVKSAMRDHDYEVILVDDGSADNTVSEIKKYADERIKLVVLSKNYGQTTAMSAGIHEASGDYVVTMDGDLQNDPSDIPRMLEKLLTENWDVVAGIRTNRKDGMLFRKVPSKLANALIRSMTGVYLHDYGCSLKVFRSRVAKNLGLYGELHRFIPVLASMQGASMTEVEVKHHPRIHGRSKYGINRTFKVISDLILIVFFQKYLQKPMHLFGAVGLVLFFVGIVINIYLLIEKIGGADIWGRPLLLLGILLLIAGVQLVTFGVMVEILMRTYFESQNKQTYQIRETFVPSREVDQVT
jgi:glycosyltransferase involved in cell wall biosynthesis